MSRRIYGSNPHTSLFLRQFNSLIQATSKHRSYRLLYDRVRNASIPEASSHSSMRLQSRRERHAHQTLPSSPHSSPILPIAPGLSRPIRGFPPPFRESPRFHPNPHQNIFTQFQTTQQPRQRTRRNRRKGSHERASVTHSRSRPQAWHSAVASHLREA